MLEKHLDQARRQGGGFQGGSLKLPFWPSEGFIHCLAIHFKLPTICDHNTLTASLLRVGLFHSLATSMYYMNILRSKFLRV